MNTGKISRPLFSPPVDAVLDSYAAAGGGITVTGFPGSAKAWLAAGMGLSMDRPLLAVLPTAEQALVFHRDLRCWLEWIGTARVESLIFPEWDVSTDSTVSPDPATQRQRLEALHRLAGGTRPMVVAPAAALIQETPPRRSFIRDTHVLSTGAAYRREDLIRRWTEHGYRRVDPVERPGEFCVRGGVMDLYSPALESPVRLEWSGDTIESIRPYDPESQLSSGSLAEISVLPMTETADGPAVRETLLDYIEPETVVIVADVGLCSERLRDYLEEAGPEAAALRPANGRIDGLLAGKGLSQFINLTDWSLEKPGARGSGGRAGTPAEIRMNIRSAERVGLGLPGTPLVRALEILQDLRSRSRVMIAAKSHAQQTRLHDLFRDHELPAVNLGEPLPDATGTTGNKPPAPFIITSGEMSNGFYDPDSGIAVFTDEDLFGRAVPSRPTPRPRAGRFISSIEDLKPDDLVVHIQHGVGRYRGIRRQTIGGFESDFLVIRYRDDDTLYVPIDRLNLVQKFVGPEDGRPSLDRLGGLTWARTTQRVKKAVASIARELLDLYAQREVSKGHAFTPDDLMTREFEAAFEFEETPDQLKAIEDTKRDMENSRPMDRLICGDVGYGKTEVAMRAAFKAVADGRQVAVLVPTTLLAHQHYQTFTQRFSPFPVRVEVLSRFIDPRRQKSVREDLSAGKVDILIGTHRILQKDIHFSKLGLLVVDEEQRFGVVHKERLKQLRKSVDVLTLTATPIPRTLQMSLVGIRDLSTIETPLPERMAVRTVLARFDRRVIREAILRELSRGGQVFFVHNRIEDIERIGAELQHLVPEIRLGIAHGRMRGPHLESVMLRFIQKSFNVLLSTAIIESGLDIPSANTILINNAHRFGLSDLYQLRGRVGRSSRQGYAYLLVPSERHLTGDARSRLSALQEFCELGAGFRIAAKDLEIRGAGHLLGRKQSGHIAAVGYEYFLQLIEKAVRSLKGQPEEEWVDPALDFPVSAFLPETYIPDVHQRLNFYRRLSDLEKPEGVASLRAELRDRYGPWPEPVERLLEVVEIKSLARALAILKLTGLPDGVSVSFSPDRRLNDRQMALLFNPDDRIQFTSETGFKLFTPASDWPSVYPRLKNCLQRLLGYDTSRRD
jgi:transcription-repair coupling factor (superfamily II helicase)